MNKKLLISGAGIGLLLANFVLDAIKSKKEHEEIVDEVTEKVYEKMKSEAEEQTESE